MPPWGSPGSPPRSKPLTTLGRDLQPILFAMHAWGEQVERHQAKNGQR